MNLSEQEDGFINLSNYELTQDQKDFLNLGLGCRIYPKWNQQDKKAELELLYQQICHYHKAGKIEVNPNIQEQLSAESTKHRGRTKSNLVTPRLRQAAKELRDESSIIIRRADKSSIFVILDRNDYLDKVKSILQDSTKFEKLNKNPVEKTEKGPEQTH